mmetsp:Transcript_85671/g.151737  ORF Transcript_85671/g.151737 Transcript_85671/m.151737 type:complete len:205 (+) Transcript_85671:453-1067(+)
MKHCWWTQLKEVVNSLREITSRRLHNASVQVTTAGRCMSHLSAARTCRSWSRICDAVTETFAHGSSAAFSLHADPAGLTETLELADVLCRNVANWEVMETRSTAHGAVTLHSSLRSISTIAAAAAGSSSASLLEDAAGRPARHAWSKSSVATCQAGNERPVRRASPSMNWSVASLQSAPSCKGLLEAVSSFQTFVSALAQLLMS